jgi:hypothetical protein
LSEAEGQREKITDKHETCYKTAPHHFLPSVALSMQTKDNIKKRDIHICPYAIFRVAYILFLFGLD